jgi:hypothetical protein
MAVTSTIVNVNAVVTAAPAQSTLQQSGALVSIGGTDLQTDAYQYCGTLAQVEALLSTGGNYTELLNMATTFFAQGTTVGLYVLELGTQVSGAAGITALEGWIAANPGVFYAYLTPASWDSQGAALNSLAEVYAAPTGKTYFFVSTTQGTINAYATTKSVIATVPSPSAATTEFQAAALFNEFLANAPSLASPAAPMAYRFLFGVTPWSLTNNQAAVNAILTAYGNVILTGAEGGISTACLFKGTTMDGNQMMWWYGIDWLLINAKTNLAAALINAANSVNPIYYRQSGINRLLAVTQDLCNSGVAFGLLESATPTATDFQTYIAENPNDYKNGAYNGFQVKATGQNGFLTITFNLDATQFAA